ncbi:LVIVD repeat-containing protein [Nocardioides sp. R-C-SC26]|uniref:LVIVD repeat-containing protein n=1 Tax=Nocardioides sp. R-C-SC26 TaxID=2870414 RepID=UPI001E30B244|nr:lactonase family protein [Nocardioides sp. R-C-SC26]
MSRVTPHHRHLLVAVAAIALTLGVFALPGVDASAPAAPVRATPPATCGPGSLPETGMQGRVPTADHESGRAARGYRCNTRLISHRSGTGGFKVFRYTDRSGRTCAYYDSTRFFPTDLAMQMRTGFGVIVLDMSRPSRPRVTTTLTSAAMLSPHESLLVHPGRGLLAGVLGNAFANVGILDLYDIGTDCRRPRLLSTTHSALLGHESGWSPDGRTLYASSSGGQSLTAIDVSDPRRPRKVLETYGVNYHGLRLSPDGRTLYAANISNKFTGPALPGEGLRILDVSSIQDRARRPEFKTVSDLVWPERSIPQVAQPFTRNGRAYVLQVDEFSTVGADRPENWRVGAARIIDVEDADRPAVVSNLRLDVHQPTGRRASIGDPGATNPFGGYTAHYCSLPYQKNPRLAACSMIGSGLRVFDISDLRRPREVAYFNAPVAGEGSSVMAQPAWDVAGRAIWFTDTATGFYAVRLTNGVGRLLART